MDKCKSKCYDKNTKGVNPTYLNLKKETFNFCFDNLLDENSTTKCESNDISMLFPIIDFSEKEILNMIYNIKNWQDSRNYFVKFQNITNKKTIERIISYSWISFYDSFKINIDIIIEIYDIYLKLIGKKIELNLIKDKIYELKKNETKKEDYHKLILSNF